MEECQSVSKAKYSVQLGWKNVVRDVVRDDWGTVLALLQADKAALKQSERKEDGGGGGG